MTTPPKSFLYPDATYCLGCLPDDTRTIASHLYACLLFYPSICPPYCCQNSIRTMNLWPWYFLPGTYPFSSTFGMLLNLQNKAICDLTLTHLPNYPLLSYTPAKLLIQFWLLSYFLSTWKISHLVTMFSSPEKSSLTLQVRISLALTDLS